MVEAADGSGSLLTAHLALQYNRDVFTVPGPITSRQSQGTNKLLKLGAIPCMGIDDILEALHIEKPSQTTDTTPREPLTADEQQIADALASPRHIDDLTRALKIDTPSLMRLLTELELKGVIEEQAGNIYARLL